MADEKKRYTRSSSQLKAITRCSWAYYLSRFKKVPEPPAAWTALGVALHEAFQEWEEADRSFDVVDRFAQQFDAYIAEFKQKEPDVDKWQMPPGTKSGKKCIERYRTRGIEKDVPSYRDRCLEAEWQILRLEDGRKALELPFEIQLGDVSVRGAIDNIKEWPGSLIGLEDVKTGNIEGNAEDTRQLALYRVAAKEVYGLDIKYARYFFTKVDRAGEWMDLTSFDKDYLTEQYRVVDEVISNKLFLPNPGKQCGLCGVRDFCREAGGARYKEVL